MERCPVWWDVMHCPGDRLHQPCSVSRGHGLGKVVRQRPTRYVLEYHQEPIVDFLQFVKRDDVGMPHRRYGLSFTKPVLPIAWAGAIIPLVQRARVQPAVAAYPMLAR